jgi:hypothetical protein
MKNVEENVAYLEDTSPSSIINPSKLKHVTKQQLQVVEFIAKCTGHFLRKLMKVPGNSSYHRLITTDYEINFDNCVKMFESILCCC